MANVSYKNLANGIDARSAKSSIKEGYSEIIENMDCSPGGYLSTRKGYIGQYGELPLRVKKYSHIGTKIRLQFDSSQAIDLSNISPGPLLVRGTAIDATGVVASLDGAFDESIKSEYFLSWELVNKQTVTTGVNNLTISQGEHGLLHEFIVVGASISDQALESDNTSTIVDSVIIDSATYDIDVVYNSAVTGDIFLYSANKEAVLGTTYIGDVIASSSITIPASTHQLNNYNILVWAYEDVAGGYSEVTPNSVTISGLGEVVVDFTSSITGYVILSCTDNYEEEINVSPGSTDITITNPGSPHNFYAIYYTNAGTKYQVIPNSISYDEATDSTTIDYTLGASAELVSVVWENADVVSNVIELDDPTGVSAAFITYDVDMYAYGISHSGIYKRPLRGGHVNHLDSFRSVGEGYLISGLGGNLFKGVAAADQSETLTTSGYPFIPTSYSVNYFSRVASPVILAPLFNSTATNRTRGEVVDSSIVANTATVTGVQVNSSVSFTITLQFTSAQTLTGKIATTDKITLTNMPYAGLNGEFQVAAIGNDSTTTPTITLFTTGLKSRWSALGLQASAGCFTDVITTEVESDFTVGTVVGWSSQTAIPTVGCIDVTGTALTVDGITEVVEMPDGLKLAGSTTASTIIVGLGTTSIIPYGIVLGDYLTIGDFGSPVKVVGISTANNTITVDREIPISNEDSLAVEGRWLALTIPVDTDLEVTPQITPVLFDSSDYDNQAEVKSTMMNGNLFFVNGSDEVMKYDGEHIYHAGLPNWQPKMFSSVETTGGGINPSSISGIAVASIAANKLVLTTTSEAVLFRTGSRWQHSADSAIYTVQDIDLDQGAVYFTRDIAGAGGTFSKTSVFRYYFRISYIDTNGNIIVGPSTSHLDSRVELGQPSNVIWKLVGLPAIGLHDFSKIKVDIFRTSGDTPGPFYRVGSVVNPFSASAPYILFKDTLDDILLSEAEIDTTLGSTVPSQLMRPIRASYISTANNRLLLGNCKSYPTLNLLLAKREFAGQIAASGLNNVSVGFYTSNGTVGQHDDAAINEVIFTMQDDDVAQTISAVANNSSLAEFTCTGTPPPVGSWVYLYHATIATDNDLTYSGHYRVTEQDIPGSSFTIDCEFVTGAGFPDAFIHGAGDYVPVYTGVDGNYSEMESNVSDGLSVEIIAVGRLAVAINSVMKAGDSRKINQLTTPTSPNQLFRPWLMARAGNDYGVGELHIEIPDPSIEGVGCYVDLDLINSNIDIYVNNTKNPTTGASSEVTLYPSRVIQSIPNSPEVFNYPAGPDDLFAPAAKDVNASDGQVLTSIATFFGESALGSGSALHDAIILFKENSIYAYDSENKIYQKLDTRGLGCTVPKSVSPTKNGLMFANEAGVYRLNRDMSVGFAGEFIDRMWKDEVNKAALAEAAGHQNRSGGKYKLCVPGAGESFGNYVFAYDIEGRPDSPYGAWTKYTNHKALMWCNLGTESYFASQAGRVFKVRNSGSELDYRDDADAIAIKWRTRAEDFGSPGIRKSVNKAVMELQLDHTDVTGLQVSSRTNLKGSFQSAGSVTVDSAAEGYAPIRLSLTDKRGVSIQLEVTHGVADEEVMISGLSFDVEGLSTEGIKEAGSYT